MAVKRRLTPSRTSFFAEVCYTPHVSRSSHTVSYGFSMADREHVAKLKEGTEAWNRWSWELKMFPDLSGANLRGVSGAVHQRQPCEILIRDCVACRPQLVHGLHNPQRVPNKHRIR